MNHFLQNLTLRDKKFISIGILFLALFLLFEIILSPLANHNADLRESILDDQKLLTWMKSADERIQIQEKLATKPNAHTPVFLLGLLQKQINQSAFKTNLIQLNQAESHEIQLTFKAVNFDQFIQWLATLCQQQNLSIMKIQIVQTGTMGLVDTMLYLT